MATKYEKLEAEYQQLSTPEQQWAWVLAHKDEVKVYISDGNGISVAFKKAVQWDYMEIGGNRYVDITLGLLSVLGIETEEV